MNSGLVSNGGWHVCSALLCVFLLGCQERIETTSVSGQVTYKGQPVERGAINFFPSSGGRPLAAVLDMEGRYQTQLPADHYTVAVQAPPKYPEGFKEGDPLPPPDPKALPARFSLHQKSGLAATIEKQSTPQEVDFTLK